MSNIVLCARCYCTPESVATGKKHFDHSLGREDGGWDHFCSEAHLNAHDAATRWEPVEECARVGMAFVDASLMMHMWMMIGRTDEPAFAIIQARRQLQCEQIQALSKRDELKALAL